MDNGIMDMTACDRSFYCLYFILQYLFAISPADCLNGEKEKEKRTRQQNRELRVDIECL